MRRATARRMRLYGRLVLVGTIIGATYGSVIGRTFRGTAFIGALVGATDGAATTAAIAAIEIFLTQTRWGRSLQRAPFLITFGVKWLVYGVVITAVNVKSPGVLLFGASVGAVRLQASLQRLPLLFSFAGAVAAVFVFEISRLVGRRIPRGNLLSRSHL